MGSVCSICCGKETDESGGASKNNGRDAREVSLQPEPGDLPRKSQAVAAPEPWDDDLEDAPDVISSTSAWGAPDLTSSDARSRASTVAKKRSEKGDDSKRDAPGFYVMTNEGEVCSASDLNSDAIAELAVDDRIQVLEILNLPLVDRVRARIAEPAGWITLMDTSDGYRWAEKASSAPCAPDSACQRVQQAVKYPHLKPGASESHSTKMLAEAMTEIRMEDNSEATRNFRNILIWMQDHKASREDQEAAGKDVVNLSKRNALLVDEIFIQLMRQLRENPSRRSEGLGWELLARVCKVAPPSAALMPALVSFLGAAGNADEAQRCASGMQALKRLPKLSGMLHKKRSGRHFTRSYDRRYCVVRNMLLLYYGSQAHAEAPEAQTPDGGPKAKGCIALHLTKCRCEADLESPTIFSLIPEGSGWDGGSAGQDADRVFTFDTRDSPHDRDAWMAAINKHIHQAHACEAPAAKAEDQVKSKVRDLSSYEFRM